MILNFLVGILFSLFLYFFVETWRKFNFFKNNGVPHSKLHPIFGSLKEVLTGKLSMYEGHQKLCEKPEVKNEPFFGFFMLHQPAVMIQDSELIKRIMVKDFNSFSDRFMNSHKKDPVGYYNMFTVKGEMWRRIRHKLSPFFTSGKLKGMFYLVEKTGDDLIAKLEKDMKDQNSINVNLKDLFYLFTTDNIARCAFGLEANTLENPNNEFSEAAKHLFSLTFMRKIEQSSFFFFPKIAKYFNFKIFSAKTSEFFLRIVPEVMREREKSQLKRHDLIDTLVELDKENEFHSIEVLVAQAAVFFGAGFETTSTTMTLAMYEIAMNRQIHAKLRDEIREKVKSNGGHVSYDLLMSTTELPYLHQVVLETLRMYPVVPFLERKCVDPSGYSLEPFSSFIIPFKMPVHIPIYAICRDEKFFPNPSKFDPDRFMNIASISQYTFFPFGVGPRNCVGERFGLMAVKMGLIKILLNFQIEPTPETPKRIIFKPNSIQIQSQTPLNLNFVRD